MSDIARDRRSKSARRAARTKAVRGFDKRIKEIEDLIRAVKVGEISPTKANTVIRAYSCMLEWTKAKRQVYLEEILEAEMEELKRGAGSDST